MEIKILEPGVRKLAQHLGHLDKMVKGDPVAPIHVSIWPTVRCQLNCSYCCCRNEDEYERSPDAEDGENRNVELTLDDIKNVVDVLHRFGTKAIEFSGGGEPTLWPHLEDAVDYIYAKGIKISLITNCLSVDHLKPETISKFAWVRVSIQSAGYAKKVNWKKFYPHTKLSFSYIVSEDGDLSELEKIHRYVFSENVTTRIAIQRPSKDGRELEVKNIVDTLGQPFFFSHKEVGTPKACYMAWVRAAIDWRGNFLVCPASQLSTNSEGKIYQSFGLCHIHDLEEWLIENPPRDLGYRCKFCNCGKEHNDFVDDLMKGVDDAEFC
jgi:MoaA/NifB/PqqE/SkfB family radical SAM enzyme